jgi:hypothetical protein
MVQAGVFGSRDFLGDRGSSATCYKWRAKYGGLDTSLGYTCPMSLFVESQGAIQFL